MTDKKLILLDTEDNRIAVEIEGLNKPIMFLSIRSERAAGANSSMIGEVIDYWPVFPTLDPTFLSRSAGDSVGTIKKGRWPTFR